MTTLGLTRSLAGAAAAACLGATLVATPQASAAPAPRTVAAPTAVSAAPDTTRGRTTKMNLRVGGVRSDGGANAFLRITYFGERRYRIAGNIADLCPGTGTAPT